MCVVDADSDMYVETAGDETARDSYAARTRMGWGRDDAQGAFR